MENLWKLSRNIHRATNLCHLISQSEITAIRMKVNHTNEEVAEALGISSEGVRKKLKRAYKKLGVGDLTQAVLKLKQGGLL